MVELKRFNLRGIETVFTQDLEDEIHNLPDFQKQGSPFPLDKASLMEGN